MDILALLLSQQTINPKRENDSEEEVTHQILRISGGKSTSIDGIPDHSFSQQTVRKLAQLKLGLDQSANQDEEKRHIMETQRQLTNNLVTNITALFNSWLEQKFIPITHTTAKLIFKLKGSPSPSGNTIDDYRPIGIHFNLLQDDRKYTSKAYITPNTKDDG